MATILQIAVGNTTRNFYLLDFFVVVDDPFIPASKSFVNNFLKKNFKMFLNVGIKFHRFFVQENEYPTTFLLPFRPFGQ
jgi:hypothetical protein